MADKDPRFVWLDLEMTGLDPRSCVPIEIGIIVTGADLEPLGEMECAIWQPDSALETMEPFVRNMHTQNGLLKRVRASKSSLRDAEKAAMALVTEHCAYGQAVLAGNSIHTDRAFLLEYFPNLEGYLHYRQLDVSSLKVLTRAWYPSAAVYRSEGEKAHTALSDIRSSIEELSFYRRTFFRE